MRIVGRTHSRMYRPELCIIIRAFGAQAFIVTGFAPSGQRLLQNMGIRPGTTLHLEKSYTLHNFKPCIILHLTKRCPLHNFAPGVILHFA